MSTLKKILMVDDDADLREALADQLVVTEEFDVFEAGDRRRRARCAPRSSTTTSSSSTSACPTWTAASCAG